jgi:hypothetical protein
LLPTPVALGNFYDNGTMIAVVNISMLKLRLLRGVAAFDSVEERMSTYLALYPIYAMACATARFGKTYGAFPLPGRAKVLRHSSVPGPQDVSCLISANGSAGAPLQPAYLSYLSYFSGLCFPPHRLFYLLRSISRCTHDALDRLVVGLRHCHLLVM